MATGDQTNILARLKTLLPPGWFPASSSGQTSPTPILDGILSGFSAIAAYGYSLIQYVKNQTRIATATDGWLDIISLDLFGGALPRNPGELDPAFRARIRANLFLPANTRAALQAAVQSVTGYPVRMIEPWQPNDNARYGSSFYGYNRAARPGQYANGNQRTAGLIVCSLPASSGGGGQPRRGYGGIFYTNGPTYAAPAASWYVQPNTGNAEQIVFSTINKFRALGVRVFVKFVPPAQLP